jgi:hypothetical protein
MDAMRQAIADHMVRSKQTSPHVYSIQEIDVTNIANWRAKHKSAFEKAEGFGLSFTPFFLEAAVKALEAFPYVNASVEGKKIILKKHVNLGCAVALGNDVVHPIALPGLAVDAGTPASPCIGPLQACTPRHKLRRPSQLFLQVQAIGGQGTDEFAGGTHDGAGVYACAHHIGTHHVGNKMAVAGAQEV